MKKLLLVIVAALLSAQAQDEVGSGLIQDLQNMVESSWMQDLVESGWDINVVESGRHDQWGSLRYLVKPGEYIVMGELIQGGGVAGIPRVRNPSPQVVAEQVERSVVEYTARRDPRYRSSGEFIERELILYDPITNEPVAYFNNEWEARQHLTDRYFDRLISAGAIRMGEIGALPHFSSCTSASCQEFAWIGELYREEDRLDAERGLQDFLDMVGAIIDFVRDIVDAIVGFFESLFQ